MMGPKISASRLARLHNEGVNRVSDELSFEEREKPGVLSDRRENGTYGGSVRALSDMVARRNADNFRFIRLLTGRSK